MSDDPRASNEDVYVLGELSRRLLARNGKYDEARVPDIRAIGGVIERARVAEYDFSGCSERMRGDVVVAMLELWNALYWYISLNNDMNSAKVTERLRIMTSLLASFFPS